MFEHDILRLWCAQGAPLPTKGAGAEIHELGESKAVGPTAEDPNTETDQERTKPTQHTGQGSAKFETGNGAQANEGDTAGQAKGITGMVTARTMQLPGLEREPAHGGNAAVPMGFAKHVAERLLSPQTDTDRLDLLMSQPPSATTCPNHA